ncbi:hypothetical protein D3C87_1096460 [compost metagenome]
MPAMPTVSLPGEFEGCGVKPLEVQELAGEFHFDEHFGAEDVANGLAGQIVPEADANGGL